MAQSPPTGTFGSPLDAQQILLHQGASDAFRQHRYADADGRYMALADAGHLPSARMALLMQQNGSALFGGEFAATTSQYARWNALVIHAARHERFVGIEARSTE